MEEKARQIDVKVMNKQQTKKNNSWKSKKLHEDFNESSRLHCRYWRSRRISLSSKMRQRLDSIETLSHDSNQFNDLKNQQLSQKIAELEMENLITEQNFSQLWSGKKFTKAEKAAMLAEEII